MTNHPLTDEMCEELTIWCLPHDAMRAAYDKGFEDAVEYIRKTRIANYAALHKVKESFYKQQEDNSCESTSSQTEHLRRAIRYWGGN